MDFSLTCCRCKQSRLLLFGAGYNTRYGRSLACGDVNGDGWEDIAISSNPDYYDPTTIEKVTVMEGRWELPDTVFLASDTSLTRLLGESHGDYFGRSLSLADYNGDGNSDLVVSAKSASPLGRSYAGEVFLFLGTDSAVWTGVREQSPSWLAQNYPNPFNPSTTITCSISKESTVELRIFDVRGSLIKTLVNEKQSPNVYRIPWDGMNNAGNAVGSGLYFYRLKTGGKMLTRKMVLLH